MKLWQNKRKLGELQVIIAAALIGFGCLLVLILVPGSRQRRVDKARGELLRLATMDVGRELTIDEVAQVINAPSVHLKQMSRAPKIFLFAPTSAVDISVLGRAPGTFASLSEFDVQILPMLNPAAELASKAVGMSILTGVPWTPNDLQLAATTRSYEFTINQAWNQLSGDPLKFIDKVQNQNEKLHRAIGRSSVVLIVGDRGYTFTSPTNAIQALEPAMDTIW